MRRFFWENFQAPHTERFGFCDSSLFLYATMTFTTILPRHLVARARKRKPTFRSHDLKISGKKKVNTKVKGISHI